MCNLLSLEADFLRRKLLAYLLAFWPEAARVAGAFLAETSLAAPTVQPAVG
jgi:tRNA U34 5-methylaminomethyl-2-thiouridine-forming methyltransferase MnmC